MAEPTRVVRLSRAKGSKREPGVVVVDRSTRWGNPFRVGKGLLYEDPRTEMFVRESTTKEAAVARFESWLQRGDHPAALWIREHVHELAGQTLGCWCDQDGPCHAQVLARLADEAVAGG